MPLVENQSHFGKQVNILHDAITNAAEEDNKSFYSYIEETPKTSLIVEIIENINRLGYQIVKK